MKHCKFDFRGFPQRFFRYQFCTEFPLELRVVESRSEITERFLKVKFCRVFALLMDTGAHGCLKKRCAMEAWQVLDPRFPHVSFES